MQNGLTTLWNLFDGSRIIKVPNYQRAYSWSTKNLKEFTNDIANQSFFVNKKYFMGTLLLQRDQKEGNYEKYLIVDGQQRLTTVVMYINILLKKLKNSENDYIEEYEAFIKKRDTIKFQTINSDSSFFSDYILSDNEVISFDTSSQKRLLHAKAYFEKYLAPYTRDELLRHLETIKNTNVLIYTVENSAEATLIFETTNDRGKKLTDLESLKSFFMHKAYLSSGEPESVIHDIEGHFEVIYREYEKIENLVDEDDILRYFYIAEWNWSNKKQYQNVKESIKKDFNRLLNNGQKDKCLDLIKTKVRILKEYFVKMRILLNNEIELSYIDDLVAIGRIATFYPILLKSFVYKPKVDQNIEEQNFEYYKKVVHLCEIFAFKGYGLANKRADTGLPDFYKFARDFDTDYVELIKWLKELLSRWNIPKRYQETLNSPYFYDEGSDARYLLWKYENFLRKQAGYTLLSAKDYMNRKGRTAFSIEHIAAQKGEEVKKCLLEIKVDEDYVENYLHSIGNLAIDPLSSNVQKSNLSFENKQYKYFSKAPLMSHNELEEIAQKHDGWNADAIKERAVKLIKFAEENWDENKI